MSAAAFSHRLATEADLPALDAVMERAIAALQNDFLTPEQVRASHKVMGLDRQLVADRTYFIVERESAIAGCGGWSWRSTLYGGDDSIVTREPRALDRATEPARIRAMYTEPSFARQGVGRFVMQLCERAAQAAGFRSTTMMATLAGVPLYKACGYQQVEEIWSAPIDGVRVPLIRMEKSLDENSYAD